MLTDLVAPLFYVIVFCTIIYKADDFRLTGVHRSWPLLAFTLKILAGFVFWAVYSFYYTDPSASDAFRYFADAHLIKAQWYQNRDVFWSFMTGSQMDHPEYQRIYDQLISWTSAYRYGMSNDCSTIIRINVVISFISFGSFHVHALFMSFMSFIGLIALYKAFCGMFIRREKWLFLALFAIPSVVFWSSSLLKEGPLLMCLGLFIHAALRIFGKKGSWLDCVIAPVSFLLLFYIKGYVIITLVPSVIFLLIVRFSGYRWILGKWIVTHLLCFIVAQQGHLFFRGGDFLYVLHKKQVDFYNIAYLRNAGSLVEIPQVSGVKDFILNYPQALALTYFRPFLSETYKTTDWIFAIENFVLLVLIILAIFRWQKVRGYPAAVLLMMLSFVLVLAAVLGNTVPILGAIVRYKIPALPFLVILCFYFLIKKPQLSTTSSTDEEQ